MMLDFDLAAMYGVETRVMNQAVKRNIERFLLAKWCHIFFSSLLRYSFL